jgi:hypothetical protein
VGALRQLRDLLDVPLPRRLEEVPGQQLLGPDDLPGHRGLRRAADPVLNEFGLSSLLSVVVAAGIGLVAGVSLSGSV